MSRIGDIIDELDSFRERLDDLEGALELSGMNANGTKDIRMLARAFGHFSSSVEDMKVDLDMIIEGLALMNRTKDGKAV